MGARAHLALAVLGSWLCALHVYIGWLQPHYDLQSFTATGAAIWTGAPWYANVVGLTNLNPPLVSLVFAGFPFLPLRLTFLLWTLVSVGVFLWSLHAIGRAIGGSFGRVVIVAACLAAVYTTLRLGQVYLVLAALVTAIWLADRRYQLRVAGILLGVAIYWKPFLGLVAIYWLWRRSWLAVMWTGATVFALVGVSVLAWPIPTEDWLLALAARSQNTDSPWNLSLMGVLARVAAPAWATPLVIAAVATLVLWRLPRLGFDQAWALVLVSALLFSPVAWLQYEAILIGPLLAVAAEGRSRWLLAGYVVACLPPLVDVYVIGLLCWGTASLLPYPRGARSAVAGDLLHDLSATPARDH